MLETEIKNNTAALAALAAAVADLTAALRASAPAAPAPVAAPAAPVAAPAAPVAAPAMSGDDLRKLCVRAGAAGLTAEVVSFLSANGCQKLAQLPPEKYGDLVALLASKGVE